MDKRKEQILITLIKEHIKTAAPVSSGVLVSKYKLDISPATARNEMADLEEDGFIKQPHTSAGRIPTEKAYNFYIEKISKKNLTDSEIKFFKNILKNKDELNLKQAAKAMAKISNNAIFWAFHRHNLYYTGISNLLSQPEFAQDNLIYDISSIIDQMDEIINKQFGHFEYGPQVLLGSANPFSKYCSSVLAKYNMDGHVGLIGILGPIRMDYEKNLALVNYFFSQLESKD